MTLQSPPARPATYQDVLDAPAHLVAELIRGRLSLQPRPRIRHALAASSLGVEIGGPFQRGRGGPGGWWILDEPELHLGADVLAPDLAGWRRARMPSPPDVVGVTLPPDWVCEVLSPSTRATDLTEKRAIYAEHGVAHLWFVDPDARMLEAFALRDGAWALIGALAEGDVRMPPFEAVAWPLGALWPDAEE